MLDTAADWRRFLQFSGWNSSEANSRGPSVDDRCPYDGMQSTDMSTAPLVICPICPVTDGIELKMRSRSAEAGKVRMGRVGF